MTSHYAPGSPHRTPHEASHQPWAYSRGAVFWDQNGRPLAPNIEPAAANMRAWLKRETSDISGPGIFVHPTIEKQRNPYTENLVTLAGSYALILEDACKFIELGDGIQSIEAEIRRVRLESELVLYTARFCEAAVKQMLHCTSFPRHLYKDAAMGQLLAQDCRACRKSGAQTHSFSLLGSLAHQYYLCPEFEHCGFDHLILANKRRNLEAAHSSTQHLRSCTPDDSRQALRATIQEVGEAFTHILKHIASVEIAMIKEIRLRMKHYPDMPPREAYSRSLTRTAADYDNDGVYQGPGYRDRQTQERQARRDAKAVQPITTQPPP